MAQFRGVVGDLVGGAGLAEREGGVPGDADVEPGNRLAGAGEAGEVGGSHAGGLATHAGDDEPVEPGIVPVNGEGGVPLERAQSEGGEQRFGLAGEGRDEAESEVGRDRPVHAINRLPYRADASNPGGAGRRP